MSYTKSIKDRLLVYVEDLQVTFCVLTEHGEIPYSWKLDFVDPDQFLDDLNTNTHINQPFSEISLILNSVAFTLFPNVHGESENSDVLFQLGNTLKENHVLLQEPFSEEIDIHYTVQKDIFSTLKQKFESAKCLSDASLVHAFSQGQSLKYPTRLCAGVFNNNLLVLCYHKGKLAYANKYPVQNSEDLFYFLMLGTEVFKINLVEAELHWLSNPEVFHVDVHELFHNYVQHIEQSQWNHGNISPFIEMHAACA